LCSVTRPDLPWITIPRERRQVMLWGSQDPAIKPIDRVREIMRLLGPESIGSTVDLGLIRGGAPTALRVVIAERPVA
jgi:hypothetical protein